MDTAASTAPSTAPLLIPMAAATSGDLPAICALTGRPTAGRWSRRARDRTQISIPISEDLLARYAKRTLWAKIFMLGFVGAWAAAIVVAIPAGNAATSDALLGAIAAWLFVLGALLFTGGAVVLALRVSTVPLRWSVLVGEDGRQYLRIGNPSPAFADALKGGGISTSITPRPELHRARAAGLLMASALLPGVLIVPFFTGHVGVAAGVLVGYVFLAMVGSVVSGILVGTRRSRSPRPK